MNFLMLILNVDPYLEGVIRLLYYKLCIQDLMDTEAIILKTI